MKINIIQNETEEKNGGKKWKKYWIAKVNFQQPKNGQMGSSKEEKRGKELEEIMAGNFPKLMKTIKPTDGQTKPKPHHRKINKLQAQDSWEIPRQCTTVKLLKTSVKKGKILKAAREKQHVYKRTDKTSDFSSETIQVRRQWGNIFKGLKEKTAT